MRPIDRSDKVGQQRGHKALYAPRRDAPEKDSDSNNADTDREDVKPPPNISRQTWVVNADRSRVFLYQIAIFMMRTDIIRRLNSDGDLDRAGVLITVWIRTVESGMRTQEYRDQFGDLGRSLDYSSVPTINATSIAGATGLARETVRRKLKALEKEGLVVKEGSGRYRLGDNPINKAAFFAAFQQIMQESSRFLNACIDTRAVESQSNPRPSAKET